MLIKKGFIERLEDGIAWGVFDDRTTMDIPTIIKACNGEFKVNIGNEIFWMHDEDDKYIIAIKDNNRCVGISVEEMDDGYEIDRIEIFVEPH